MAPATTSSAMTTSAKQRAQRSVEERDDRSNRDDRPESVLSVLVILYYLGAVQPLRRRARIRNNGKGGASHLERRHSRGCCQCPIHRRSIASGLSHGLRLRRNATPLNAAQEDLVRFPVSFAPRP